MDQVLPTPDHPIDSETIAAERPGDHREELRLWLRLLTCTTMIEGEIRRRLRRDFDVTLPRFDLMAQLEKARDGMTLSDISKRMMVSNGNITGLVDRLVASGHVARRASETDRRSQIISLTESGHAAFRSMADAHEDWVAEMFAGLTRDGVEHLMDLLARTKSSVREASRDA